jgi:hypothetical protein
VEENIEDVLLAMTSQSSPCAMGDPENYQEAVSSTKWTSWKKAMDDEYESLIKNDVFELTTLPP